MIAALLAMALAAPLSHEDVLAAVDARLPALRAAAAELDAAEAKELAKRGAFDPVLVGKGSAYGGKDARTTVDAGVKASTLWGPSLYVGWTRGVGDFPAYAEDAKTGESGELFARLEIPVLDGLGFGAKRGELALATAGVAQKQASLADMDRKAHLEASKRYWSWVAAGRLLRIAEDQLGLAERRADALARQVELGQRPEMDRLDNERVLQERRAKVADARRKLELAALDLSQVLRDEGGSPIVPGAERLPEGWPEPAPLPDPPELSDLGWRPDRAKVEADIRSADIAARRARNALLPDLSVSAGTWRPIDSDLQPETVVGVSLEAPLALREGRGGRAASLAMLEAARAGARGLDDAIRAEIAGAFETRRLAEERAEASREAAARASDVLEMERRRLELGAGDLFQLLLREDSLAKARESLAESEYHLRMADALLAAALSSAPGET